MGERQFNNKRAVAYIRVASAAQADSDQIARRFHADIVAEYVDFGTSARTKQRPGLQLLLDHCASGDIHYAISVDDARFSRDATVAVELRDVLRRSGTSILTKTSALVDELHSTLLRVMTEIDHHERSERAKDGWVKRRARRQAATGRRPT